MITNQQSGTRIDEIEDGIYRISTAIPPELIPGGFSFNQYLIDDDEPLVFHTGPRAMFPLVSEAIASIVPVEHLRWISFSHVESDECGGLNDFLRVAPEAAPLCSGVAAMVSVNDLADRPPRAMQHGEELSLGRHTIAWLDAPHVPHNWETGYLFDKTTGTLFCGDLFTQGGHQNEPLTESDILEPSETFRTDGMPGMPNYYSYGPETASMIARMADTRPTTLACMHGSAWRAKNGEEGASLMHELASRLIVPAA